MQSFRSGGGSQPSSLRSRRAKGPSFSWALLVFLVFCLSLFAVSSVRAEAFRGDTSNYIVFTSPVPVSDVSCAGHFSSMSSADFTDVLTFISGSTYSYQKQRTFTHGQVGKWKFKFTYTDTALAGVGDDVTYVQWTDELVYPDSSAFHGSASGLTAQTIWEYTGTNTTDPARARTVVLFMGSGTRKLVTTVRDATTLDPIQGAEVQYLIGTANKGGPSATLANGTVTNYLAPGFTYDYRVTHNNYLTGSGTLVLGAAATDTTHIIGMTLFDPGDPPLASLVRVYGTVKDFMQQPAVGVRVKWSIVGNRKVWYKTVALTPYTRQDTTDASGDWYLDVYPNDSLTPATTRYLVVFEDSTGQIAEYTIEVPGDSSGGTWRFPSTAR